MCIFCQIINKEIPANLVYEDKDLLAFRDINPQAPVHILIIPKKHIPGLAELKQKDFTLVAKITEAAQKLAREQNIENSGYRLVANNGSDGGQAVDHLHYHLLGGRKMTWPPG